MASYIFSEILTQTYYLVDRSGNKIVDRLSNRLIDDGLVGGTPISTSESVSCSVSKSFSESIGCQDTYAITFGYGKTLSDSIAFYDSLECSLSVDYSNVVSIAPSESESEGFVKDFSDTVNSLDETTYRLSGDYKIVVSVSASSGESRSYTFTDSVLLGSHLPIEMRSGDTLTTRDGNVILSGNLDVDYQVRFAVSTSNIVVIGDSVLEIGEVPEREPLSITDAVKGSIAATFEDQIGSSDNKVQSLSLQLEETIGTEESLFKTVSRIINEVVESQGSDSCGVMKTLSSEISITDGNFQSYRLMLSELCDVSDVLSLGHKYPVFVCKLINKTYISVTTSYEESISVNIVSKELISPTISLRSCQS